jgi:NADH:ubiquinone oxidoreductase subunit 4 (subunit M)
MLTIPVTSGFIVWPLVMVAFAVKVPMFPAHIWLPEAHVEAPTVGSVLLAGVLLKLGVFAILRFLIPIFPVETQYFSPLVMVFALMGIIYVSLTTIRQIDLKKIIAYASVAHMNYVVLGVFGTNILSLTGAIFLMIGHGIVSAGLFFMIGFLYDRYKTRNIRYYRGLISFMPLYGLFLFILSLANMSFPGTCNFIGESIILFGVLFNNIFAA